MFEGSYILNQNKRYPCPVCCRHFARDYDLILATSNEVGGKKIYICESNFWDDFSCDFSFAEGSSKEEIDEKARQVIDLLKKNQVNKTH